MGGTRVTSIKDHEQARGESPDEFMILWDQSLWGKAIRIMPPRTILIVHECMGHGKKNLLENKSAIRIRLLPSRAGKRSVAQGVILDQISKAKTFAERKKLGLATSILEARLRSHTAEIELAILRIAVAEDLLPASIVYNGIFIQYTHSQASGTISPAHGFLYFIRNADLYKIGITDNLLRRLKELRPDEIISVIRCSNYKGLERELHRAFKAHRVPQTEYFRLSAPDVGKVHKLIAAKAVL
jgi:hypothetical protein